MSMIRARHRAPVWAHRRAPLLVLSCIIASLPVSGDWLIGRDGERIETRGPWTIKRSSVVFTAANGALSSLRLADVDLEASQKATAEAAAKQAAPAPKVVEPAKRSSVLVLTNDDVARAAEPAAEEAESFADTEVTEPAAAEPAPSQATPPPIEVISWRSEERGGAGGLEILGTLRNDSADIVTGAGVQVSLFDHDGELVARRDAFLDALSIAGRATVGFRALFPGVEVFEGEPVFEVRAQELGLSLASEDREGEP